MLQISILCLLAGAAYLGHGWMGARAEVVQLQRTVSALKRQLMNRR